jgi:hypothetical protein
MGDGRQGDEETEKHKTEILGIIVLPFTFYLLPLTLKSKAQSLTPIPYSLFP